MQIKSSRKIGINSLSVLSHHRAYRSVHGGSLNNDSDRPVIIREKDIVGLLQAIIGDGTTQDIAIGNMPVTFPSVCPFPCLVFVNTKFDEIAPAGTNPFPLFPNNHPQTSTVPFVYP